MADTMQNQAMERVRQMYQRASTQGAPSQSVHNEHSNHASPQINQDTSDTAKESVSVPLVNNENKQKNLLDIFMQDKEKSLIVLLIVILLSEKADQSLILALLYLIL